MNSRQLEDISVAIEENEERLRLALKSARIGIWDWSIEEDKLTWDDNALSVFGINRNEFCDNSKIFEERVHPNDIKLVKEEIAKCRENGDNLDIAFRFRTTSGLYLIIRSRASVIVNKEGKGIRMVGVVYRESECPRYMFCPIRKELINNILNGVDDIRLYE